MKQLILCFIVILFVQARYSHGQTWEPLDDQLQATVYSATVLNSEIYIGTSNAVMRYNGSQFDTIGLFNSQVSHLGAFNSELYAAGSFTQVDGNTINGIARWDGASWHPLGTGVSPHTNFFIEYNNELYVTGSITTAGDISVSNIAKWKGTEWSDVDTGLNGVGNKMEVHNSELFVIGYFSQAGGTDANNIARWDGNTWKAVSTGLPDYTSAYQEIKSFNNKLFVSAYFQTSEKKFNLAIWDNNIWEFTDLKKVYYAGNFFIATSDDALYAMPTLNSGQVFRSYEGTSWELSNYVPYDVSFKYDTLSLKGILFSDNILYAYGETIIDYVHHNNNQIYGIAYYKLDHITGILNHKGSSDLIILAYPNPVTDILHFESRMDRIEVFNAQGMSVARHQQVSEISMAELPAGVYLIRSGEKQARVVKR